MLLLLVGFLALVCQVVLLRELNVAFYGVELVYAVALSAWMVGTAAGAAFLPGRLVATRSRLSWLLAGAALLLPAEVAIVRAGRLALGGVPGAFLPFDQQVLVLAVSLLPISLALGLAFAAAAGIAAASGRSLAWAYAVESAGAGAGAAGATVAFACSMQTFTLAMLTAGLVPATLLVRRGGPARRRVLPLATLLLTAAAVFLAPRLDLRMTAWTHPTVVESRDSPYARITATATGSQTALFVDDVLVYESEAATQEELAHFAALMHPAPRRMLLLGGSAERLDRELRQHHPDRLDVVELDRTYVEVADWQLRLGSTVVIDDPREYLRSGGTFDLIVVAMPQPTSGQTNRFYTAEFFAECRRRLAAGGVVAFRLDMPENVTTPLVAMRAASVLSAVGSAFRCVAVLQGASALVAASDEPLSDTADTPIERWQARGLATRLVTPAYLRYLFQNDRRPALMRLLAAGAAANSDARPVCYPFAAVNWLAKFFPALLSVEPGAFMVDRGARDPRYLALVVVGVALAFARSRRGARSVLLAASAGFSGMVLETVLLLAYQARSGALFERIGMLLTAFMAGLAVGAWGVWRRVPAGTSTGALRWTTVGLLAASAALCALTATLVAAEVPFSLAGTGVLLVASGALVGGVFACAAIWRGSDDRSAAGRLYGADLLGGALGSLLAGLVLVPTAGLAPTAWMAAALGVMQLMLVP